MSIRVFLSCPFDGLADVRLRTMQVFRRLRVMDGIDVDLVSMEDFGLSDRDAQGRSIEFLDKCDAFLGILVPWYGSIPDGEAFSFSHLEYEYAVATGKKVYLAEYIGPIPREKMERDPLKLQKLQEWHLSAKGKRILIQFGSAEGLAGELHPSLARELRVDFPDVCYIATSAAYVKHFQMDNGKPFIDAKANPKSIDICALTALDLFHNHADALQDLVSRGCQIRILFLNHGGGAANLVARARPGNIIASLAASEAKAKAILSQIGDLRSLNGEQGSLKIRLFDWVVSATMWIVDRDTQSGIAWIGTYTPDFTSSSRKKWFHELTRSSSRPAFDFYCGQFEGLWARAQPVIWAS